MESLPDTGTGERVGANGRPRPWEVVVAAASGAVFLASLAAVVWVGVCGGGEVRAGDVRLLAVHEAGRPFVVGLAAAVAVYAALARRRFPGFIRAAGWPRLCFAFFFFSFVLARSLSGPLVLHGDGREYVMQTQAIVHGARLSIDFEASREQWNRTNPYGTIIESPSALPAEPLSQVSTCGGLYLDRHGKLRFYHFWTYSLAVAPLYALLDFAARGAGLAYHSFRIMNAMFLALPFVLLWRRREGWPLCIASVLALASPLVPYVDWPHPELFCFSMVMSAFLLAGGGAVAALLSPIMLGLAASHNVPILLFFPLLFAYSLAVLRTPGSVGPAWLVAFHVLGGLIGIGSMVYFHWHFGAWSVIEALGYASAKYATASRTAHVFLSPAIGALWLFPASFFLLPAALSRRRLPLAAMAAVVVAAAAWMSTATRNFNAGQVGSVRYAVWLVVPSLFMSLNPAWIVGEFRRDRRGLLFAAGAAVTVALILYFHSTRMIEKDIRRFGGAWRNQPEVAAIYRAVPYHDDVEVLAENIMGRELRVPRDFRDIYVWNLGRDRSMWVIPEAAVRRLKRFEWETAGVPRYRCVPSNDMFAAGEGGRVTLAVDKIEHFAEHPVFGRYLLVWVDREVVSIGSNVRVHVSKQPRGNE